ncbi:DsbA family protein [Candidatus Micrarchaeota archaeon]|nr:DsbA family protein [Candidatus Micrarchaeota archaeon]
MEQMKFLGVCVIIAALVLGGAVIYSANVKPVATPTPTATVTASATASQGPAFSFNLAGKTVRGSASAKITMVEVSDFQCPYCSRAQATVEQVLSDYSGKVKLYYVHFPLEFHEFAQKAAEASECAGDQGKFWQYHDLLFANQNALDAVSLKNYAKQLKLDSAKFDSCLDTGAKANVVLADLQQGLAAGVSGTPMFFLNGVRVCGAQPYSAFQQVVNALLANQKPADVGCG